MKKGLSFFLAVVLSVLTVVIPQPTEVEAATSTGVVDRLAQFASVYKSGMYFTRNGKKAATSCAAQHTGSSCPQWLANIPAKSSGSVYVRAGKELGCSACSCCAFSAMVFYYVFGWSTGRAGIPANSTRSEPVTSFSQIATHAKIGDVLQVFSPSGSSVHWCIFKGGTSTAIKTYDANVGGYGLIQNDRVSRSFGELGMPGCSYVIIYHAINYDIINSLSASIQLRTWGNMCAAGFINESTGKALTAGTATSYATSSVFAANTYQTVFIESSERKGYRISVNGKYLAVDADAVASGNLVCTQIKRNDDTQCWLLESLGNNRFVIRNAKNPSVCLTVSGANIIVTSYTGAAAQRWYLRAAGIYKNFTSKAYSKTMTTTEACYIRSIPCSKATDVSSVDLTKLASGAKFYATQKVTNSAGNVWYYGYSTVSGTKVYGYVYSGSLK